MLVHVPCGTPEYPALQTQKDAPEIEFELAGQAEHDDAPAAEYLPALQGVDEVAAEVTPCPPLTVA